MSTPPAPAWVVGYLAVEADVCVLLRSGPGKKTLMVRWDLATDRFDIGQWLTGWVAGGQLSADGRLFVYRAYKRKKQLTRYPTEYPYSVVCRPPFFTALAFWNDVGEERWLRWTEERPEQLVANPAKGRLPEAYRAHLTRVALSPPVDRIRSSVVGELVWYRERIRVPFYALADELLEADWADVDRRGRLLLTRKGRVFVRDEDGERELIDLNPFTFSLVPPSNWAKAWPKAEETESVKEPG